MIVKLKEIASFSKGMQINGDSLLEEGKYDYLNGGINPSGKWNEFNVKGDTVAISEGGNSCGYVNYMDSPFWCGGHCYYLYDLKCNTHYLFYALKSQQNRLMQLRSGACMPNIKQSDLGEFEFEYCTDEREQLKIVSRLVQVDSLIELKKQQLIKIDELVKSRFIELFGDPVQNPMEWKLETLKKVTTKIGSGATPKGGKESYQTEGITLIRSMNVHDGRFEYKDLAHITDEQAKQLDNVTVEENDVFINITGASVARSCIVPKHILPARVNQHVAIIRCITSMLNPVFANQMFLNTSFKGQLLDIGESGGATRQAITKQQLEALTVILPPLELQEQFAAFVEQTDKSKLAIKDSLEKLETLKKALMQEYFD